jgi:hypothetical protein
MSSRENSLANRESLMDLVGPALARGRYDAGRSIRRRPSTYVSRPPDQIWGQYNNYRKNGVVMSVIIHVAVLGLVLSGALFGHQIVQKVESRQTVTLIAPSPDSCALPTSKQVVSGG